MLCALLAGGLTLGGTALHAQEAQVVLTYDDSAPVASVEALVDGDYVLDLYNNSSGNNATATGLINFDASRGENDCYAAIYNFDFDGGIITDESYIWTLHWENDNTFTLQNKANPGVYFSTNTRNLPDNARGDMHQNNDTYGPAHYVPEIVTETTVDGKTRFFLKLNNPAVESETDMYLHTNNQGSYKRLSYWDGGRPGINSSGVQMAFHPVRSVASSDVVEVTYRYNVTDVGISFEQTVSAIVGDPYAAPAVDLYTITDQPKGTVTGEETESVVVNCTASYPGGLVAKAMTADGQFATDAKWYTLSVRGGQAVVATDDAIYTKNQTRQLAQGNMWTFVKEDGNPDEFKVYNLLKGAANPLYMANNGGNDVGNTVAAFGTGSEETGTSTFLITTNGDGFNLQYPGTPNANLGDHGSGGVLAVWNDGGSARDGGSCFVVAEVNDLLDAATAQEYPGYVGSLLPEAIATLNSAKEAFAEGTETTQKLTAFIDTYNSESSQLSLTDGGYYRIQNTYSGNFLTADASLLKSQSRANGNASQIWKIERTGEDTYRLTAQGVTPAQATTEGDASTVTMGSADGETVMTLHIGHNNPGESGNLPANLKWFFNSDAGNASTTQTSFYSNGAGNVILRPYTWGASIWNIQEASTLDFTVSDAGYATAHFAFPVRMDDGMTAYVAASREDNVITLTEIENGEVPAMTPVVIAAEPRTYKLDILAEAPAGVESNLLNGSLLPYDIQESPAYIFGVDEAGTPTFYRVADDDSSQLGANKAYFAPQGDSAASRYILRFGNEGTTGIQGVGTADEAESETYYDLSGRRVLYPAKGIYVTGSGKKVFLK